MVWIQTQSKGLPCSGWCMHNEAMEWGKHSWFDSTLLPCSSEKLMVRAAFSIILPCWAAISSFSVWVRVRPTMLFFLDGECLSAATNQHKQVMYCTSTKFLYCHLEIRSQVRQFKRCKQCLPLRWLSIMLVNWGESTWLFNWTSLSLAKDSVLEQKVAYWYTGDSITAVHFNFVDVCLCICMYVCVCVCTLES